MSRRQSRREISDADLKPQVRRVWEASFRVYVAFVTDAYARRVLGWRTGQ